eukprot:TRINITY_DN9415_c0_g1_i1.p1 TRINITY_DN9415_c0_g1~~TRINITY_DN9415_c0_g1_i1.p1  ORF type:complete len:305 (+),score=77.68 TRINITY_DN9415_c0_g1_i1:78-917(+)
MMNTVPDVESRTSPDAAHRSSFDSAASGAHKSTGPSGGAQRVTARDVLTRVKFSDSFRALYNCAIVAACVLVVVAAWADHMHSPWFLCVEGALTALFLFEVLLRIHSAQGVRAYVRQSRLNCVDASLAVVCAVLFMFNATVGSSTSAEAEAALIGVRYSRYARYVSQVGRICLFGLVLASSSQKLTEAQQRSTLIVEAPGGGRISTSPEVSPSHRMWLHDDEPPHIAAAAAALRIDNSPPLMPSFHPPPSWTADSGAARRRDSPAFSLSPDAARGPRPL